MASQLVERWGMSNRLEPVAVLAYDGAAPGGGETSPQTQ
jgi:hypothetical protein